MGLRNVVLLIVERCRVELVWPCADLYHVLRVCSGVTG